ncbi:MAG: hypothetical protein L3J50_02220 [Emcibacter sp.]|nr:hypothetical protein [Emcibacter sp.]
METKNLYDTIISTTTDFEQKSRSFINLVFTIYYAGFFTLWSFLKGTVPEQAHILSVILVSISLLLFAILLFFYATGFLRFADFSKHLVDLHINNEIDFNQYSDALQQGSRSVMNDNYLVQSYIARFSLWFALMGIGVLVFVFIITQINL